MVKKDSTREIRIETVQTYYQKAGNFSPRFARAVAGFFGEEVKLVDQSIKGVLEKYPELNARVNDIHSYIYMPADSCVDFVEKKLPLIKTSLKEKRAALSRMNLSAEQNPQQVFENSAAIIRRYERKIRELENLVGSCAERFKDYLEFIQKVLQGIEKEYKKDQSMQDIQIRNEIYRNSLGRDTGLLGYDLRLISKLLTINARDNLQRLRVYRSLGKKWQDEFCNTSKEDFVIVYPPPLGPKKISDARKLHEELLLQLVKDGHPRKYRALEKAIEKHFDNRLNQIFQD